MTDRVPPPDARPSTWLDAFPWLRGAAEQEANRWGNDQLSSEDSSQDETQNSTAWWDQPIDSPGTSARVHRLRLVAELALERLTRWTLGEIFPGLPSDLLVDDLDFSTRALNAIKREGARTCGDLAAVTLDTMLDWRNVGLRSTQEILLELANASTSSLTPSVISGWFISSKPGSPKATAAPSGWAVNVVNDLLLIAKWQVAIGLSDQPLLGTGLLLPPVEVQAARSRLESVNPRAILNPEELDLDIAGLLDASLGLLDPRAVQVLADRVFADTPLTLDEIGKRENVTRERIRQIEGKARGELLSSMTSLGQISDVATIARDVIGSLLPLDELLLQIPALSNCVESVRQPAWRVLDRLDDAYEIEDGWCAAPTIAAAESATVSALLELANQYGVVRLEDVDLVSTRQADRRQELNVAWLIHCGTYVIQDDVVLIRTNSVADYAAAVLSLAGTPMSCQEIVDKFVFQRTPGSLRNAMGIDERFERVDRDRWALREWGLEAYSGIRSLIRQQVGANHGRVELASLIESITGRYSVSASSVTTYASSPPFELRDGIVRLADVNRQGRKPPEKTRRLFRKADAWAYRIRITKDHLRGSGSPAPVAIANLVGLSFGESRQLESALGSQIISWTGSQPGFGTIRRFLMDRDVAVDSEAFLIIHDDGRFSFETVPAMTGDPIADGLALIGSPTTDDAIAARKYFAAAIGLDATAPLSSIIAGYRDRGDSDIAEILINARGQLQAGSVNEAKMQNTDIDAILDLL